MQAPAPAFRERLRARFVSTTSGRELPRPPGPGVVAITEAMRALPFKRVMLDGEAVAHCLEGLPHFHKLLGDGQATACFYAFDLLWLEAQDVRGVELIGRRRMLQKVLNKVGPVLRFSEHLSAEQGEGMFRHACAMGWRASSRRS
jgi:ATP-dependent DNA ligase